MEKLTESVLTELASNCAKHIEKLRKRVDSLESVLEREKRAEVKAELVCYYNQYMEVNLPQFEKHNFNHKDYTKRIKYAIGKA
jgi:hypothetical protein